LKDFIFSKSEWCVSTPISGESKDRKVHTFVTGGVVNDFGVHNLNFENSRRAVLERVFYVRTGEIYMNPFVPNETFVFNTLKKFKRAIVSRTPSTPPVTHEEFVGMYVGRKRAVYERARLSLLTQELTLVDAYLSAFVKAEKVNRTKKIDPAPRLIQPRNPRYNLEVGCFIKPLEHRLYKSIDDLFGDTTVAKGMNADQRGRALWRKWNKFKKPIAIFLDAHRFDQHVSKPILKWEHSCYVDCYQNSKKLKALLAMQLDNRGYVNTKDGRVKYRTQGKRGSGDMNTAVGNVFIMCGLMWTYTFEVRDVKQMELFNDGDDCVVIVEKEDFDKFQCECVSWFATLGFKMKLEGYTEIFEHVEFCQSQPVRINGDYRMVRDPRVVIDKDNVSVKNIVNKKTFDAQRGAIAGCGLALAGDMPVMGSYYKMLCRGTTTSRREV